MKEAISNDYKKMVRFSWAGLVIATGGGLLAIAGFTVWDWDVAPSLISGFVVWGVGMALLAKVEAIKKENDLVTYRELVAYSKGEPIDRDNPKSRRARQHRVAKTVAIVLAAAIAGGFIGYFGYQLIG